MAWCPFAIHLPLSENHYQGHIVPRAIIVHTAWSNSHSLFKFFEDNSNLESHFYVRETGEIEQYMDTQIMADANKNANSFAVSIETWDGQEIRPWTVAQLSSIVRLCSWLCYVHDIPAVQIPTATGAGIGWHVMFGAPGPWTPVAKSCPGAPRIEQMKNEIIPRVARGDEMTPNDVWMAEVWHKYKTDEEAAAAGLPVVNGIQVRVEKHAAHEWLTVLCVRMGKVVKLLEGLQ